MRDAECFTHPWSSANKSDISKLATRRRKKIYDYFMKLYEEYKESQSRSGSGNDSGTATEAVAVAVAATRKKRARDDDIEVGHHGAKRRKLDDGMETFGNFSSSIDGDNNANTTSTSIDSKGNASKSKGKQELPWHCNYGISKAKLLPLERMAHAKANMNMNANTNTDACEKYSQVVHNSPIDISTIRLILSLAYSMMAIHRLEDRDRDLYGNGEEARTKKSSSNSNSSLNKSPIWQIHDEIEDYFKHVSSTIDTGTPFDNQMMSAPLALVSSMRQRYIANSGMYGHTTPIGNASANVSPDDHLEEDPNEKNGIDYSEIADELASYGHTLMDQKLKVFHTIHLTTGIAVLAKSFPNYSAEILSRPCFDNSRHREGNDEEYTPFDLMRMALEETDRRNGLIRGKATIKYEDTSNVVSIDKLIQEFGFAAQMFQGILRYEPNHFDTYCWYVAARIGSVVLASGNNIGQGARAACPHDFSIEENDPIFGNRSRHVSYDELRAHASRAFRQFLCLPQKSNHMGERYHIAVTSLLEWKEAINLLAMRPQLDKNKFHTIRCLHATHTLSLARFECSDVSFAKLLDLSRQGYIARDEIFNNLGLMIEKYPHDPKYWNILASGLQSCRASRGRHREPHWWAHEFIRRWDDLFFDFPKHLLAEPTFAQRSLETIRIIRDSIVVRTDSQNHPKGEIEKDISLFDWGNLKNLVRRNQSDGSWLWPIEPSDMDEEDHLDAIDDATDEIKIFDTYLPQKIESGVGNISLDDFGVATNLFSDMAVTSTALAVKSIIAHEMYSQIYGLFKAKQYIKHTMQYLLQKCVSDFETKGDCDAPTATEEFGILVWLQENTELDVVRHLDRIIERARRQNKVKSRGASINVGNNLFQFASI